MPNFIIISYYTQDITEYSLAKDIFVNSLEKAKVEEFFIKPINSLGDWRENTKYKSKFILECLEKFKKPVVFIDIDAYLTSHPSIFNDIYNKYDIALHYLDWELHYGRPTDKGIKECLSGTLYFTYNDKAISFIKEWHSRAKNATIFEQKILDQLLKERKDLRVFYLPREYCYINSRPNGLPPAIPCSCPVIVHYQLSRKFR